MNVTRGGRPSGRSHGGATASEGYLLGLDLGASGTTAAVRRPGAPARPVTLGPGGPAPSMMALGPDGSVLVGVAAQRRSLTAPGEVLRDIVRRVGDPVPLVAGARSLPAGTAVGLLLTRLVDEVVERQDAAPQRVAFSHPGGWGSDEVASVLSGVRGTMVPVPAPVAVVAARGRPDGVVAVLDLETDLTASIVRAAGPHPGALLGPAAVLPRGTCAPVADAVLAHVRRALGSAWPRLDPDDVSAGAAVATLRSRCARAVMALSALPSVDIEVDLPPLRARVRLDRATAAELVAPVAAEAAEVLGEALDSSGIDPARVDEVVLTGAGARYPAVAEVITEVVGRPVVPAPVAAAAVGSALLCPPHRVPVTVRAARPAAPVRVGTGAVGDAASDPGTYRPRREPAGPRHRRPRLRAAVVAASTATTVLSGAPALVGPSR